MIKGRGTSFQPCKRILASLSHVSGREPAERALRQLFYLEFELKGTLRGVLSLP